MCLFVGKQKERHFIYVGVTSDLLQRIWQHKNDFVGGFTKRYGVHSLVRYETCGTMETAISREKAIKEWKRAWKIRLIEEKNPDWRDLYEELI